MTRSEIISLLYNDKDINQAIRKMQPIELQEELKQEMFLALCEKDEETLLKMYNDGWIKFFLVRTMLNMVKSDRSTFFKKFRQTFVEYTEINSQNSDENLNFDFEQLNKANNDLQWYEREILKLYANKRNIVQISKETKIPYRSVLKTILKAKQKMKQALKKPESHQTKLIGCQVNGQINLTIDINEDLSNEQIIDLLELISEAVNEKINKFQLNEALITNVSGIRIQKIL